MSDSASIGVVGASGGVGASTLVGGLAEVLAREGRRVVCVDGHPFGGGLDTVLGLDREPGLRWGDLRNVRGSLVGARVLTQTPSTRGVSVISHDRDGPSPPPEEAWLSVLDVARVESDACLIDLPAPLEPGFASGVSRVSTLLLVVGSSIPALAAAGVAAAYLTEYSAAPVWLCQRVRRQGPDLPAVVAEALAIPVAGGIPDDTALERDLRQGVLPGYRARAFRRSCEQILRAVALS